VVSLPLPRRLYPLATRCPAVLRGSRFRRYWLSQVVSMSGTWMQQVALSLVVLSLTHSALAVGAVGIAGSLPLLLFTLHGGIVADRYDRRRILLVTQSALGGCALIFALLISRDLIAYWQILTLALLLGITSAFEIPASQAFVPELVDPDDLPQAIALNSAAFNAARLVGPALAGLTIAVAGTAAAFTANAVSFLAVIAVLISMRGHQCVTRDVPPSVRQALHDGLGYVRQRPYLAGLIGFAGLTSLLVFPHITVLLPLYVTEVLGAGPGWVGGLLSCIGGGSLLGALAMLKAGRSPRGIRRRLILAAAGMVLGLLGLAVARTPLVAAPTAVGLAFCLSVGMAQIATRVQQLAPDELRGRILSIYALAFTGMTPIAVLLVSVLTERVGQAQALLICAIVYGIGITVIIAGLVRTEATVVNRELSPSPLRAEAKAS
jgi:MFS family permease